MVTPEPFASLNKRHFVHRAAPGSSPHHAGKSLRDMPVFLFPRRSNHGRARDAHQHLVFDTSKSEQHHKFAILPAAPQSSLIHQVGQGSGQQSRRAPRDDGQIHIVGKSAPACVYARMSSRPFTLPSHPPRGDRSPWPQNAGSQAHPSG